MSFSGKLKVTEVAGNGLAVCDSISKSSDPYFVLKFPDGESFKSHHISENLNPVWPGLTLEWEFSNLPLTGKKFRIELWDYDLIGSDDEIGAAEFDLQSLMYCHTPGSPITLKLITSKGQDERGSVKVVFQLICPELMLHQITRLDASQVIAGLKEFHRLNKCIQKESAAANSIEKEAWRECNDQYLRQKDLLDAIGKHCCSDQLEISTAAWKVLHWRMKQRPAEKDQNIAPLSAIATSCNGRRILSRLVSKSVAKLTPELHPTIIQLFVPLLTAAVSDRASQQYFSTPPPRAPESLQAAAGAPHQDTVAVFDAVAKVTPAVREKLVETVAASDAAIQALETFCLAVPFTGDPKDPAFDLAKLLCSVYDKGSLKNADTAKLTHFFGPWLTDLRTPYEQSEIFAKVFQSLEKKGVTFDRAALFKGKALPLRAVGLCYPVEELPLVGRCPSLPSGGLKALPPAPSPAPDQPAAAAGGNPTEKNEQQPAAVVHYFLPQTSLDIHTEIDFDKDAAYRFDGKTVTFVQGLTGGSKFVPVAAQLLGPRASPAPVKFCVVWTASRLPDLADLDYVNAIDSAALFFSSPHSDYLTPLMWLDTRSQQNSRRAVQAVTVAAQPTEFLVIRMVGQDLPSDPHIEFQTLKILGVRSEVAIAEQNRAELETIVARRLQELHGSKFVPDVLVEPEVYPRKLLPLPAMPGMTNFNPTQTEQSSTGHPAFFVGKTYYPCFYNEARKEWLPMYTKSGLMASSWNIVYDDEAPQATPATTGSSSGSASGSESDTSDTEEYSAYSYEERQIFSSPTYLYTTSVYRRPRSYLSSHCYYRPPVVKPQSSFEHVTHSSSSGSSYHSSSSSSYTPSHSSSSSSSYHSSGFGSSHSYSSSS